MANVAIARRVTPALVPFVCCIIGGDAGEPLNHILVRKEAERVAGSGEFYWGLSAKLGADVEDRALQNGSTLPALFAASKNIGAPYCSQIAIWEKWESVLDPNQSGPIPSHVIVTSAYDPKSKRAHYALVCYSDLRLTPLGNLGLFRPNAVCNSKESFAATPTSRSSPT